MYRMVSRVTKSLMSALSAPDAAAQALQQGPIDFADSDIVHYTAKPGHVTDLESDRTLDALLSGQLGPAVVLVYADWCGHCKNMMDAYEMAAKQANVPFVRIQGAKCPVSARKYQVLGYPTIFGVATIGGPLRKFGSARTIDNFVNFGNGLTAEPVVTQVVPVTEAVAVVEPGPKVETMAPTVEVLEEN